MAYLACILGGIIIGLVISRFLPARIQIKGKIWQWGRNSKLDVENNLEVEKKPRKRRNKRNKKSSD